MEQGEKRATEYISYNGLGRNPCIWGIPYMVGLAILCVSLMSAMVLGMTVGPAGWALALIGLPIAWFVKSICETDDKAVDIVLIEAKWVLIKLMRGNAIRGFGLQRFGITE